MLPIFHRSNHTARYHITTHIAPISRVDFFVFRIAGTGGILRLRRSGRAGRTTPHGRSDPETGEPTERGRFVQLRLRER